MRTILVLGSLLVALASNAQAEFMLSTFSGTFVDAAAGVLSNGHSPTTFALVDNNSVDENAYFPISESVVGETIRLTDGLVDINQSWMQAPVGIERQLQFQLWGGNIYESLVLPMEYLWHDGIYDVASASCETCDIVVDSHYSPPNGYSLNGTGITLSAAELVITDWEHTTRDFFGNLFSYYTVGFQVTLFGVPEPSGAALMVAAMGLLWCKQRR